MLRPFPAPPRGPSPTIFRILGPLLALVLCHCSLSLEDPAQEARDKLAKAIPATVDLLIGRWIGDSTYTADDTRASSLKTLLVRIDILPDTTYIQSDTGKAAFPGRRGEGRCRLSGDTLILGAVGAAPDTFAVKMRFLGNYLELYRPADRRYIFFHKLKPPPDTVRDSLLADTLWFLSGRRPQAGSYRAEARVRDFSYLRFRGDSLYSDVRVDGIIHTDSGPLLKDGAHWTWNASAGKREYLADMPAPDTLRLWPLAGGRPDSGYADWARAAGHHPYDIDMRRLLGHLRGDSLRDAKTAFACHYGRYYDWILDTAHTVTVETDMDGVPRWTAWHLDSGQIRMSSAGRPDQRMRVDTAGGKVRLRIDSGAYFSSRTTYTATLVQGDFEARPLDRFDSASYLALAVGGDSAYYFFGASNDKNRFEIYAGPDPSSLWAGFVLPAAQETYQSGQAGFYLAFHDSTRALGRFTCRSRPDLDLVIRQTLSDPAFADGYIQGTCAIQRADSAYADSVLAVGGAFKMLRAGRGGFGNPGWSLP